MKVLALALALAGLARPAFAQGTSYDVKTSGDITDPRTGTTTNRVFSAAHGQFANGTARLDFTESMMPGGMMAAGSYMIVRQSSPISIFVFPDKRQYLELNRDELSKDAADAQKAIAGIAKTELSGVRVDVQDLGAGGEIEGYSTQKYQITTDYTMTMTMMGHTSTNADHSVTEMWIAPGLDGLMNPMARQPAPAGGAMAELTEALAKAYTKMKSGLVLKSVMTTASERKGTKRQTTLVMQVTNLKRTTINPAVFQIPTGFARTEGLGGALNAMMGDSIAAARARTAGAGGHRPR